jgi:DNA-binding transcriptional LysR family regulator
VDLELARVRAFVAVTDEGHFGRAAAVLSISQQALSKRVARLEAELGARLLDRGGTGTELTEAGRRFLDPARRLLAAADTAAAALTGADQPLRVGVWGHLYQPMRTVRAALARAPNLDVEIGRERDLPAVAGALRRGEIDVGFGRVHGEDELGRAGLAQRPVRLEPVDAILGVGHLLAGREQLRPAELAGSTLMFPAARGRLDFLTQFADRFGIVIREYGTTNTGLVDFIATVRASSSAFSLLPADVDAPIETVPLTGPVPLYAWSLIWRREDNHPCLPQLLEAFAAVGRESRWLEYRQHEDWLPGKDRAEPDTDQAHPGRALRSPGAYAVSHATFL